MKLYFLLVAALIIVGTGCRKDKSNKPACRISKVTSAIGDEIRISYNEEGKYAKIESEESGETTIATYNAGSIVYTTTKTSTGNTLRKTTITLNASGMAALTHEEQYNSAGTLISSRNTVYEYNSKELVKSTLSLSGVTSPVVYTYSWTNGNMTSSYYDVTVTPMGYYLDKPIQQGDWFSIFPIITGGFDYTLIMKNKNLLKDYVGSVIAYRFDAEGRIDAIYLDGNLLYTMEYECN